MFATSTTTSPKDGGSADAKISADDAIKLVRTRCCFVPRHSFWQKHFVLNGIVCSSACPVYFNYSSCVLRPLPASLVCSRSRPAKRGGEAGFTNPVGCSSA